MKLRPLIWKETRESLIYLWIGLFVFLVLPTIGAIEALFTRAHRFELLTSPWVVSCGGVLAVFVAVGSTCRDLVPRLMDFWQSRPVSPWVWMAIKYLVGLVIVELACIVPVLVERLVTRGGDSWPALVYLPFLWLAIYSVAFLVGCLVRRTAQAAMISLVVMVLIWLLPTMTLWLRAFDVSSIMRTDEVRWIEVRFALSMTALAIVAAAAALLVAQFNFQGRANRRLMLGTIAGAGLLLLSSLGLRFGTNMPVLQTLDLEPTEFVQSIYLGPDNVGQLSTLQVLNPGYNRNYSDFVRTLTLTDAGLTLGPPVRSGEETNGLMLLRGRRPDNPYIADADANHWYHTESPDYTAQESMPNEVDVFLLLNGDNLQKPRQLLTIWKQQPNHERTWLYKYQHTLFALSRSQFVAYDVSKSEQPNEVARGGLFLSDDRMFFGDESRETIVLPDLPGVPARQRLECLLSIHWGIAWEGDLVVATTNSGFAAYRLLNLNDKTATFVRTAQHRPSAIENVFGTGYNWNFRLKNGLVYMSASNGRYDSAINPSCTVYDARDGLKQVGHFAAAGAGQIYPLADGRSIVAGRKVYLIGPVKR